MNMLSLKHFFLLIIIGLFSCEKELIIDVEGDNNQIVINSLFSPNQLFSASVTQSMSPLAPDLVKELNSAEVNIYENNIFKETMTYYKSPDDVVGKFYSTFKPEVGKSYSITVSSKDKETITGVDKIPEKTSVISATSTLVEWGDSTNIIRYYFDLTIDDPVAVSYYYFNAFFPVYKKNETTGEYEFHNNQYLEIRTNDLPKYEGYINGSILFNDEGFNGTKKRISGTVTTFTLPVSSANEDEEEEEDLIMNKSKLYIDLYSVSEEGYKFHSSYAKVFATAADIYSEPTVIYSNIENGLGIFSGENITPLEIKISY